MYILPRINRTPHFIANSAVTLIAVDVETLIMEDTLISVKNVHPFTSLGVMLPSLRPLPFN